MTGIGSCAAISAAESAPLHALDESGARGDLQHSSDQLLGRIHTRGVMPVRISRRWAHTQPVQGLARKPPSLHLKPAPWTPFLLKPTPDEDKQEPIFTIAPTSGLATPPATPTEGTRHKYADLAPISHSPSLPAATPGSAGSWRAGVA